MAEKKYLEKDQVPYLLTKIKGKIPTKTSNLTNDSGFIKISDVPEGAAASTTTPKMDGTATVGTETAFARGDHVHPSDTNKVDKVSGKALSTNDFTNAYKTKLDGIADGANKITVDSTLNSTSTNPVQNKVVNTALGNKVDKVSGKGLSTNDYTTAEKTKLAGFSDASAYAKKEDITSMMSYMGSVATYDALPTNAKKGDTYNVESDGMNYTWTGTEWDASGSTFTINSITNAEIDEMFAKW